ncbi:hypothetical protein CTAYLR_008723 [Chrysophaeum taylorii]|uniref:RING-type E3 ubiquitin transferase n=1 Tax=Chrysophaeum taylorii TaxID=2483200 RepID=A0AAD7UIV6_9STRA|nr:hypothetical protein CTAYLR_008723 [Chrysophaeum taylorii]
MSEEYACAVCLESDIDDPVVTACGHLYCWTCLDRWLEGHTRCPVCSANVDREEVTPLYVGRSAKRPPTKPHRLDLPFPSLFGLHLRCLLHPPDAAKLDPTMTAWTSLTAVAVFFMLVFL